MTLSPVLGFVDYGYMKYAFVADRFQYLAGIGVMAVVIGAVAYGVGRLPDLWQKGALGVAAVTIVVLGLLTWRQANIWKDDETLNRHIIALNPQARNAHHHLAKALYEQGRYEEALDAARVAVDQRPIPLRPMVSSARFSLRWAALKRPKPTCAAPSRSTRRHILPALT